MDPYSDTCCHGVDLLDLLFDKDDGILRHEKMDHNSQGWPIAENIVSIQSQCNNDFLNSVSGSPLWTSSPSDSGISDDPLSDHMDSPLPSLSPPQDPQFMYTPPQPKPATDADLPISLDGWKPGFFPCKTEEMFCACNVPKTQLSSELPLTVKDLLLSGISEPPPQTPQQSVQELILSEDEKKLLAKEGVTLPSQHPLTKYEERILKKIRRKIRNKQSAQESRKKKKEYIDGLESRMAACSAQNQELQRKVFQLEKCNMSLMEQLQALVMNGSNKTAQTGTCVLVLLLSFSLILFPSLKPFSESKVSQEGDFSPVRVQSRSLHNIQSSRVVHIHDHPSFNAEDSLTSRQFSADKVQDDILLQKLGVPHRLPTLETFAPNCSLLEQPHHHGDPITGHIGTLTLCRGAKIRPHADDM